VALLYFAEGLPFGMVLDNFPVYFRVHGVSLAAIGALSLLRTPWWAKVFWSPLVDQIGERRQWIRGALVAMAAALLAVSVLPAAPVGVPLVVALFAFTIAAATQDVAIDAYTIELLAPGEEGMANGVRVSAYRAALIFAGGVLVALAAWAGWPITFQIAAVGLLGLAIFAGRAPSTAHKPQPPRLGALAARLVTPRRDSRLPLRASLQARHERDRPDGEAVLGRPWPRPRRDRLHLDDLGVAASVAGALVGGALTSRWGIFRALWVLGPSRPLRTSAAVAAWTDAGATGYTPPRSASFGAGLGTAAFLAFLMNICDKEQAATQYALLSALFNLSGSLAGAISGRSVEWSVRRLLRAHVRARATRLLLLPWVRSWIRT
jgi:PAT family beta-lactamase induction signal transducer AmpG